MPDIGIALVEVLAYVGDHLSYYQDAVATEAYLDTARQRISVRRHARLVDYTLHEGCNARTWVCVATRFDVRTARRRLFPDQHAGAAVDRETRRPAESARERGVRLRAGAPRGAVKIHRGQHEMHFYTWGNQECCLAAGAREATLVGRWIDDADPIRDPCDPPPPTAYPTPPTPAAAAAPAPARSGSARPADVQELHLKPGDVLIFEEVIGPKTGGSGRRRSTASACGPFDRTSWSVTDPLNPDLPLTGIRWSDADALPFPLCLSAMGPAPACAIMPDVSVARGNLDPRRSRPARRRRARSGSGRRRQGDVRLHRIGRRRGAEIAGRYQPLLDEVPLTFSEPLSRGTPASRLLVQDPRRARPQVVLTSTSPDGVSATWSAERDLLSSQNPDRHFVVEIEPTGRARLRFGDDELGQRPDAGMAFHADVSRRKRAGGQRRRRRHRASGHPPDLDQRGHRHHPESVAGARRIAAEAARRGEAVRAACLQAAARAGDHRRGLRGDRRARVRRIGPARRGDAPVERTLAEVLVAVDPLGTETADPALLERIARRLYRYRRIGHDVVVRPAKRVPLDIELLVCVLPGYLRAHVKQALLDVFSHRRTPDGRPGLFHPDRLSFGDGVFLERARGRRAGRRPASRA